MSERATIGLDFPELERKVQELRDLVTVLRELQGLGSSGVSGAAPYASGGVAMGQAIIAQPPASSFPVTVASAASAVAGTAGVANNASQQMIPATGLVAVPPPQTVMGGGGSNFGHWNSQSGQFIPLTFDPMAGQFFNSQTGAYVPGSTWPGGGGGGNTPGAPRQPQGPPGVFETIGGMTAVYEAIGASRSAAQMFAESQAQGRPFYSERLAPTISAIGGLAIGAMIGSAIPGVGTAIGAGIGAGVGGIYGELIRPGIEKGIQVRELQQLMQGAGYDLPHKQFYEDIISKGNDPTNDRARVDRWRLSQLPTDMLEELSSGILSGTALPYQMYYDVSKKVKPWYARKQIIRDMSQAVSSETASARWGSQMEDPDFVSENIVDIMVGTSWGKERQISADLSVLGFKKEAGEVLEMFHDRVRLTGEEKVASASVSLAGTRLQLATRYGGSEGALATLPGAKASMQRKATALRNLAMQMDKNHDPYQAEVLRIQAEEVELQATALDESYYSAREQETQARGTYLVGQANRGFESALYSGTPAAQLPWEQRSMAAAQTISMLQSDMAAREKAGKLSPAERYQYMEQIAGLQHQINTVIPREREQSVSRESVARLGLANVQREGEVTISTLRGSSLDQARNIDERVTSLQKEKELTDQILQSSKYLTQEERLQLQTRSEALKVQIEQVKVQAELSRSVSREGIFQTGQVEKRAENRLQALEAGTSTDMTKASIAGMQAAEADVKFYESEISELKKLGYDENHERVRELRQKQAQARVSSAEQRSQLANVPVSPEQREKRAELQTEAALVQMGLGSFGDFRANLQQQMGLATQRLQDIDARERELKKQGIKVTPEMKAQFAEQRASAKVELAQLFMQYEEGWDQRLISEVYNMPGNSSLMMSQYTHREAARAGISRRAFGGSKEQTEKMRTMYPRLMQMMGSGNPEGLRDRALTGDGGQGMTINLNLKVVDEKNNPLTETSYQINRNKTANDTTINVGASRPQRPSG